MPSGLLLGNRTRASSDRNLGLDAEKSLREYVARLDALHAFSVGREPADAGAIVAS